MLFGLTSQCFTGDTLVSTESGLRPIEDIQAGDYVWSENTETGEKELKKVLAVSVTETDMLVHVTTETGTVINTTENHPFYTEGKGWCVASELEDGDVLRTQDGKTETVASVETETLDEPVKVYNLEIEDSHTYYVSVDGVLVHNACDIPWSSGEVSHAASEISHGANSVTVSKRSQAEELFLGLFQGKGYKNTTGMTGKGVKEYFGSKDFTYHWDVIKDELGRIIGHGTNNPDGDMPHLEIHTDNDIIRIFFGE